MLCMSLCSACRCQALLAHEVDPPGVDEHLQALVAMLGAAVCGGWLCFLLLCKLGAACVVGGNAGRSYVSAGGYAGCCCVSSGGKAGGS